MPKNPNGNSSPNTASGKRKYQTTESNIIATYTMLNEDVFENVLHPIGKKVQVKIAPLKTCWADCSAVTVSGKVVDHYKPELKDVIMLRFRRNFPSEELFYNIVAHEMIHVYEYMYEEVEVPYKHGKTFFSWKEIFSQHGIPLHKTY